MNIWTDDYNVLHGLMPEPNDTEQDIQLRGKRIARIISELKRTGDASIWAGDEYDAFCALRDANLPKP